MSLGDKGYTTGQKGDEPKGEKGGVGDHGDGGERGMEALLYSVTAGVIHHGRAEKMT